MSTDLPRARSARVAVTGAGMVLPGPGGHACTDLTGFWSLVGEGTCCLSALDRDDLGLRIGGQVGGWDCAAALGVDPGVAARMSRTGQLATAATRGALREAGLVAADLDGRTVLVCASLQFAFSETERYFARMAAGGPGSLKLDYWMTGTPPSVLGTVASTLRIGCPTLNITGSCNVALRAIDVILGMFRAGDIDRAVLVGVDSSLDPIFASSSAYLSRHGYRASSLSDDPTLVRPHDTVQDGNATGEGAVAVVLEREDLTTGTGTGAGTFDRVVLDLHVLTSRNNGPSVVATGPPTGVARDIAGVLGTAHRGLGQVAFLNDYADGNRFVEDHFCGAVDELRVLCSYDGPLTVTNHEAAFGHVAGVGGMVKFVSTILMLQERRIAPVTNCRDPYRDYTPIPSSAQPSPWAPATRRPRSSSPQAPRGLDDRPGRPSVWRVTCLKYAQPSSTGHTARRSAPSSTH